MWHKKRLWCLQTWKVVLCWFSHYSMKINWLDFNTRLRCECLPNRNCISCQSATIPSRVLDDWSTQLFVVQATHLNGIWLWVLWQLCNFFCSTTVFHILAMAFNYCWSIHIFGCQQHITMQVIELIRFRIFWAYFDFLRGLCFTNIATSFVSLLPQLRLKFVEMV